VPVEALGKQVVANAITCFSLSGVES
jgi:hypothetical protein